MRQQSRVKGIRRKRQGWQAFIRVNGKFRSKQFPRETPDTVMLAWLDFQNGSGTIAPAAGSFADDVRRYLRRPEIAARRYVRQLTAQLELWLEALGRDRTRASISRADVEYILQQWLNDGLSTVTVYHRRTALGSFFTTMNGIDGTNPVRGTTKPRHWHPIDRSVPFATLITILNAMPDHVFPKPGIRRPSLSKLRVAVILHTGIAPRELMKLRRQHFDRDAGRVRMPWRDKGAGAPAHVRELSASGVAAFVALDVANGWGSFAGEALSKSFKRAARAVLGPETPVRLYDQRHSFGTDTYKRTGDLATVGRLLGHAEGSIVTAQYARGAHADVDRAAVAAVDAGRLAQLTETTQRRHAATKRTKRAEAVAR